MVSTLPSFNSSQGIGHHLRVVAGLFVIHTVQPKDISGFVNHIRDGVPHTIAVPSVVGSIAHEHAGCAFSIHFGCGIGFQLNRAGLAPSPEVGRKFGIRSKEI